MLIVTVFFYISFVSIYVAIEKMWTCEKQSLNLLWVKVIERKIRIKK